MDLKWAFIDSTGALVFGTFFERAGPFSGGLAAVSLPGKFLFFNLEPKYGYIDKTGKVVIEPKFDFAGTFDGQTAIASRNGKYGLINRSGRFVIAPKFEQLRMLSSGVAAVRVDGFWGLIDKTGREIVKPSYDTIIPHNDGLYRIYRDDKAGLLDSSGSVLVEPRFDLIHSFRDGVAAVELDDMWGAIDSTGAQVGELRFIRIPPFICGLATIVRANKVGLERRTGEIVFPPEFDTVRNVSGEIIALTKNGSVGYAKPSGNWLWYPWQQNADTVQPSREEIQKLVARLDSIDSVYDPVVNKIGSLGSQVLPQLLEKLLSQDRSVALYAAWALRYMADEAVISKLAAFCATHRAWTGLSAVGFCIEDRKDLCVSLKNVDEQLLASVLGHFNNAQKKKPVLLYGDNLPAGVNLTIPGREIRILNSRELQDIADRKGEIEYTKFDKVYVFRIPHEYGEKSDGKTVEAVAVVAESGWQKQGRKSKPAGAAAGGSTSIWFKINGQWVFQGITSSWIT